MLHSTRKGVVFPYLTDSILAISKRAVHAVSTILKKELSTIELELLLQD